MTLLNERVASPSELADELGEPLGNVSYHMRRLAELECIELVRTTPVRGALEHHYRATARPVFGDLPAFVTETGFHNALNESYPQPPVPELVAASYLLRTYLEDNVGAVGWSIAADDLAEIDAIFERHGVNTVPEFWIEDD